MTAFAFSAPTAAVPEIRHAIMAAECRLCARNLDVPRPACGSVLPLTPAQALRVDTGPTRKSLVVSESLHSSAGGIRRRRKGSKFRALTEQPTSAPFSSRVIKSEAAVFHNSGGPQLVCTNTRSVSTHVLGRQLAYRQHSLEIVVIKGGPEIVARFGTKLRWESLPLQNESGAECAAGTENS
jgi:hypothetical protein